MKHISAVNQNNAQYRSVSAWTIIPLNCLWSDLKFYKQDKSKNQDTSVLNSHHCHYPRLWNNVHQISYHWNVSGGGHVVPKKALKIPAITNPTSLSSPQCLCLSHSLSLSHEPPSSYAPPSPPVFSLWLHHFFASLSPLFSLTCLFCLYSDIHREGATGVWVSELRQVCL